jgi:pantothenate kinase
MQARFLQHDGFLGAIGAFLKEFEMFPNDQ